MTIAPTDSLTNRPALPLAARVYIGLVAIAGAVVLLLLSVLAVRTGLPLSNPSVLVVLGALGAGSIAAPLRFHRDGGVHGFHLAVAVHISFVMLSGDAVAVLATAATAAVGYSISTRSMVKTLFNVGQEVLWASAATVAVRLVLGGDTSVDVLGLRGGLAVLAAGLVAVVVNMVLTTELFHHLDGESRRSLLAAVSGLALTVTFVGNTVVAVLLVVLGERSAAAVVLATPLLAGLMLGYRGSAAQRESARKAQSMHRATSQLVEAALDEAVLPLAVGELRELFGAERAVLDTGDGSLDPQLSAVLMGVRRDGRSVLETTGDGLMAAPVVLDGRIVGALCVTGRRGLERWGEQDLALLSTLAGEVAATMRARELFSQLQRERASLQVETHRLGDILRSASDGIVLLDASGHIQAWNPAMAVLTGAPHDEAIQRRWDDVLRLEDEEGTALSAHGSDPFSLALSTGQSLERATLRLRQAGGGQRWLRCSAAPVRRNGALEGVVLIVMDLTREREVEELRGDFLATVSHELRTPLTPLRGFLSVLREHGDQLGADRVEVIHSSMDNQVARLEDLIGDLLLVAEVERSTPQVQVLAVDIAQLVSETLTVEVMDPQIIDRLHVDSPHGATALADPAAMRRVVRSLVTNACKHTDGEVEVRVWSQGDNVVLEVSDRGTGIDERDREIIFEPFRRLGNHLHRTQGPGLGLSIARALVEAQNGLLDVHARPGGGSTFTVVLPTAATISAPTSAERSRGDGRAGGRR